MCGVRCTTDCVTAFTPWRGRSVLAVDNEMVKTDAGNYAEKMEDHVKNAPKMASLVRAQRLPLMYHSRAVPPEQSLQGPTRCEGRCASQR